MTNLISNIFCFQPLRPVVMLEAPVLRPGNPAHLQLHLLHLYLHNH